MWALLSGLFVALAADELLAFHERLIDPVRGALGIEDGLLFAAWVVPGAAAVLVLAVLLGPFLRRLPADTSVRLVLSAVMFVTGALGVEAVGGAQQVTETGGPVRTFGYVVLVSIEEGLEMVGVAFFIATLACHLRGQPEAID